MVLTHYHCHSVVVSLSYKVIKKKTSSLVYQAGNSFSEERVWDDIPCETWWQLWCMVLATSWLLLVQFLVNALPDEIQNLNWFGW